MEAHATSTSVNAFAVHVGQGTTAQEAHVAVPGASWRSAVVLIGEKPTVDPFAREVARGLAEEGHGVIAVGHDVLAAARLSYDAVGDELDLLMARLLKEAAIAPRRRGIVGYGTGGFVPFVAVGRRQFSAAVAFYGAGPARAHAALDRLIDLPKRHAAPLLCLLGTEDDTVSPGALAEIDGRLTHFGMRHSFICYPRTRGAFCRPGSRDFRAKEAADAWERLVEALGSGPLLRPRFGRADRRNR